MSHVEVAGRRVAYTQAGRGTDVLLLHGAVTDARSWGEVADHLAAAHRVTAWDAPGCGGSHDPPATWQMQDFADCVAGFVEELGLDRPHVVGHSWGSSLALAVHLQHPGAVRSLVLAGPYAGWAGSLPPDVVAQRLTFAHEVADQVELGDWDPATMPGILSDRLTPARRSLLLATMHAIRAPGTRTMAEALAACDLRPQLGSVTVPTLVLAGDGDERSSPDVAAALHAAIPGSRLEVLPGTGHEMFLEAPETFCAIVRAFFEAPTQGHPVSG